MQFSHWPLFFDHIFFFLADVAFFALEISAIRIVRRTKWQLHTNWLTYFAVESGLALLYRLILNAHFFTGIHLLPVVYAFARMCLYMANITGICGAVVLCKTLRKMVIEAAQEPKEAVAALGVWPPPPLR